LVEERALRLGRKGTKKEEKEGKIENGNEVNGQ
jgi:hypothetical protein